MLHPHTVSRKGVILLVVVSLLTLFSIVGLSFVMYANSEAEGAKLHREGHVNPYSEVESESLLAHFLDQLIYDVHDDERGVFSALRGHSLLRSAYGLNYILNPNGSITPQNNNSPFSGTGRLHLTYPINDPAVVLRNEDDYRLINYQYFPADMVLRDPERPGARIRPIPTNNNPLTWPRRDWLGGFNVSYTYPDLNNMFLGAIDANQNLLIQSFHRPWLFNPNHALNDPANPNWTNAVGKYKILRPRPADMGPGFPYPEDATGDVKNLVGAPGGNDSLWIDLGFPVQVTPEGKKYKPLFAPLIIDLDNRVNVNVHGNIRGAGNTHASNQGWGRWEVDLGKVLRQPNPRDPNQGEWVNLFLSNQDYRDVPRGRYGDGFTNDLHKQPSSGGAQRSPGVPPFYSHYDFDGTSETAGRIATQPFSPPPRGGTIFTPFPVYPGVVPNTGYGNASTGATGELGNQTPGNPNHPYRYNPFTPATAGFDTAFRWSNMEALLRYQDTNSPALTSELFRLCPNNFNLDPRARNLVTTHSFDFNHMGLTPWLLDTRATVDTTTQYRLNATHPQGPAIRFPQPLTPAGADSPRIGEFERDLRAVLPVLGRRVDLNRSLPPYPNFAAAAEMTAGRYNITVPAVRAKVDTAVSARQMFARDIYLTLLKATGAYNPFLYQEPADPAQTHMHPRKPTVEERAALRYLAQLAVNIVDYLDNDNIMTPFNWGAYGSTTTTTGGQQRIGFTDAQQRYGNEWVYGVEQPNVLLNEAYAQYKRDGDDHVMSVWLELHNPLRRDTSMVDSGEVRLYVPAPPTGTAPAYSPYQLMLTQPNPWVVRADEAPFNTSGEVNQTLVYTNRFSAERCILSDGDFTGETRYERLRRTPTDNAYAGVQTPLAQSNQGFMVIGAEEVFPGGAITATMRNRKMVYEFDPGTGDPTARHLPTIVLRRLACPHLPHQNNPSAVLYNPYITVDYLQMSQLPNAQVFNVDRVPAQDRFSYGRRQPYAGNVSEYRRQTPAPALRDAPQQTFFRHNGRQDPFAPGDLTQTLQHPFDWLVHLDRQIINPMELLHVSAFRPMDLTQLFMIDRNGDGQLDPAEKFQHVAGWDDQRTRLYRFFEFVETHDRASGMVTVNRATTVQHIYPVQSNRTQVIVPDDMYGVNSSGIPWGIRPGTVLILGQGANEETVTVLDVLTVSGRTAFVVPQLVKTHLTPTSRPTIGTTNITLVLMGDRVPGKININTVWDVETFRALCARAEANSFSDADVDAIFQRLVASRTPGPGGRPRSIEGPGRDRPFRSMATGVTAPVFGGQYPEGIGIGDTLLRPGLFDVPGTTHPYKQKELLTKIHNNLTTRSNVFAVWLTVGFFEVTDENARPVKLGAEIGRAENRHVRHRMFSIVDRTQPAREGVGSQSRALETTRDALGDGQQEWFRQGPPPEFTGSVVGLHPGTVLRITALWDPNLPPAGGWRAPNPQWGEQTSVTVQEVNPPTGTSLPNAFRVGFAMATRFRLSFSYPTERNPPYNNPGPRPAVHARSIDPALVPYYSIIH